MTGSVEKLLQTPETGRMNWDMNPFVRPTVKEKCPDPPCKEIIEH